MIGQTQLTLRVRLACAGAAALVAAGALFSSGCVQDEPEVPVVPEDVVLEVEDRALDPSFLDASEAENAADAVGAAYSDASRNVALAVAGALPAADAGEGSLAYARVLSGDAAEEAAAAGAITAADDAGSSVAVETSSVALEDFPAIERALLTYSSAGYDASFLLCDLSTGTELGYNLDRTYFCASTVKAPFAAYVLESADAGAIDVSAPLLETEVFDGTGTMAYDGISTYSLGEVVDHTIVQSDNTGYHLLWQTFGGEGFNEWAASFGVENIEGAEYPSLSARDLGRLWLGVERYTAGGSERGAWLASLLSSTEQSFLRGVAADALDDGASTLSKPGFETNAWYPDDPFDYGALHDAGVFEDGGQRWLVVAMSNANYDSQYETDTEVLIDGLIEALLDSRADLLAL